jgi:hypothetical protein
MQINKDARILETTPEFICYLDQKLISILKFIDVKKYIA